MASLKHSRLMRQSTQDRVVGCQTSAAVHRVQYTSGEVEELNLEEIIADGHMSILISGN